MNRYELTISTACCQITLGIQDDDSSDLSDITEEDFERRIKDGSNCLVIYTARSTQCPVAVEFHESEPHVNLAPWSHVAEASMRFSDQSLSLMGLWDDSPHVCHFDTPPGSYRLRAHYGNLESVNDPTDDGEDHYLLVFWPAPAAQLIVLKQYVRPA